MAKDGATYEDFQPFCKWERLDESDVLEVHLLEFKKEELRVRVRNNTLLTIYGERLRANDAKKIKFSIDFKLSKDIRPDQIRAKFGSSILSITMPKNASPDFGKRGKRSADSDNGKPKNFISSRFSRLKLSKKTAAAMAVAAVILAMGAYYLTRN